MESKIDMREEEYKLQQVLNIVFKEALNSKKEVIMPKLTDKRLLITKLMENNDNDEDA